jgi:tetratricopeptide (TPR) repeat protein
MSKASFVLGAALRGAAVAMAGAALLPAAAVAQQTVSQAVGKPLKDAQTAIGRKQWDTAQKAIRAAQAVQPRSAFEDYKINELQLYVYLQQGRNADAAKLLEQQMASGQMPAGERTQRSKTLAQLHFRAGNFGKAIQVANDYLKAVPGDREMQMMVAQGYYQQKNYKGAISAAERLARGGQPSEDLLQLILRSNYELGDKDGTAKALEQLLKYYPTPQTWKSLLKTYFNQAKGDDEKLALYRLSQDVGALEKSSDYFDMAEALIVEGFPAEGRRVIESGVAAKAFTPEEENRVQRTLASAEKELAKQSAATAAAAKSVAAGTSGEDMYQAGRLYFGQGNYPKAVDALRKALAKGGVSNADDANMLLGIALARTNRNSDANKAFTQVKNPKLAEIARVWALHAS